MSLLAAASTPFLQSTLAAVLAAAVCGLLIGFAVMVLTTRRANVGRLVGSYISAPAEHVVTQKSLVERALGDPRARAVAQSPFWTRLRVELEVAEIPLALDRLILITAVFTALVTWLLVTELHSLIAIVLAPFVPFLAYNVIRMKADRQRRNFSEQLPDNLQVVASAMRAGQTFIGALTTVVEDAPEPSRRELKRALTDEALGFSLPEALDQVTERMKSEDFQHVAIVATLQRDTGGNTAEVIDLVSDTIRERIEIRRMVRGLTAQGRLAGLILSGLPVGILIIIALINPGYAHPLFHKTIGIVALCIGLVLTVAGSVVIRRIVDIEI